MNSKRIQAKGWFLTYPKCEVSKEDLLEGIKGCLAVVIEEYVICQEKHKDGDSHLHAFVKYAKKVEWKADRWDIGNHHGNYQVAKSWKAVIDYVKKDGDYISNIDVNAALGHKAKNKQLLEISPKEAVDQGLIPLLALPSLIKAKAMYALQEKAQNQEMVRGIWIWGLPGVGKSHLVRTNEESLFVKAQNKWWDGYAGEEAVLIDDFDQQGKCLGHYLKIWSDKWACTGEVKGGTIPLNFKRLYITSNYSIDDLFGEDEQLCAAIKRRFTQDHRISFDQRSNLFK